MGEDFREASTLRLLGSHIKVLTLVDVEKKGAPTGLIEFFVAALGGVEQIAQGRRRPRKIS
jgi:hypothetical protein